MKKNLKNKTAKEYNSHAIEYDNMSREAVPWIFFDKPYLKKVLRNNLSSKTKLLDLGCGGGKVIEFLCEGSLRPTNITGVDVSSELTFLAQSHTPEAHFIVGDMAKVKLHKNYFDIAVSIRSLEYLNLKELEQLFKNVYHSLKKNGKFYIVAGHPLRVNDSDITKYLNRGIRKVSLPWGMQVTLYHKTISDYLMSAIAAGFSLDFIDEPKMPDILKKKQPEKYQKYMSYGGATNLHFIFTKK